MLENIAPIVTTQSSDCVADQPPVLKTRNLKRSFGKVEAVRGVDLNVEKGQIYGFLGRNGAGKTSTIRMIMGIIKPDEGEIHLLGKTTRRTSITQKQQIGYVSQGQHFYPWMSCRALGRFVSGFYPNWDDHEFARLLKVLELPPDRRSSHLSGGMAVKLALALALAHRPALLILDEPTAGLDAVARREFLEIIQKQTRDHGRTTFFSTHRIDEVERVADRVGIILKGTMRYEGSLSTLTASVREIRLTPPNKFSTLRSENIHPYTEANGFEILNQKTVDGQLQLTAFAQPASWSSQKTFPYAQIEMLSLEDVFIACAGNNVSDL
ncbi:MAG: ABC transporter ATP-binding protein [Verrucomicrobiales bacterium]|nr:ABC transporter ATP-binding protein [Verrucomicrobiales bacterium]